MIPRGVTRVIWAIAPNEAVRDAMLGDFAEEFAAREQRDGHAAARRWCWGEAIRSLGGTLRNSFPSPGALAMSVVPAMLWGYLIALLTMIAAVVVSLPAIVLLSKVLEEGRFIPLQFDATALMVMLVVWTVPVGVIAGFETAKVGKRAPLWSAVLLGLCIAVASLAGLLKPSPVVALPVRGTVALLQLAQLLPALLVGAVLQQSMPYRFNRPEAASVRDAR